MKVLIPLAGLIDKEAEAARLSKDLEKRQKELDSLDRQLSNANFVNKARPEVVDNVKQRRAETAAAVDNLKEQLKRIQSL